MRRIVVPVLFALLATAPLAAATSPYELQRALRLQDDLIAASASLTAEVTVPADLADPASGNEIRHLKITTDGSRVGIESRSTYTATPRFREPVDERDRRFNFDRDGRLIVWRKLDRSTLAGPLGIDVLARSQPLGLAAGAFAPRGAAVRERLERFDAGDWDSRQDLRFTRIALGRGYSTYLDTVLAVERRPDGLLLAIADGHFGAGARGIWRLVVEDSAGNLVRRAEFYAQGRREPAVRVLAGGAVSRRGLLLARHGEIRIPRESGRPFVYAVRLEHAAATSDPALLTRIETRHRRALATRVRTIDHRSTSAVGRNAGNTLQDPSVATEPSVGATLAPSDGSISITPLPSACCTCKEKSYHFAECSHQNPPNDTVCSSDECIDNVIDDATCVRSGSSGANRCATQSSLSAPWAVQTVRSVPGNDCATGGQPVVWRVQFTSNYACNGCTLSPTDSGMSACNIPSCTGGEVLDTQERNGKIDCVAVSGEVVVTD